MKIKEISQGISLSELDSDQVLELQKLLQQGDFYTGSLDGIIGPLTRSALADFKHENWLEFPAIVGPSTVKALLELEADGSLPDFQGGNKEQTVEAIIRECDKQKLNVYQKAYVLATVEHETNNTFQPVVEAYWLSEAWRSRNLRYYPWHGKGYVQLTWRANYAKYQSILGVPLLRDPDRALEPAVALFVLVHGMKTGTFTGRKLSNYLTISTQDWYNARRVVNWIDKAEHIANLSKAWLSRI